MKHKMHIFAILAAIMALGIVLLPATASAGSSICPTGECKLVPAEWVPGTVITTSGGIGGGTGTGGGSSAAIVKETPVSKLKEVKKSYEKKYKVVVGYYQNPHGYEGNAKCIDPTKVKAWNFHAGTWYKTTNHLREPVPPARWKKGDKICDFKEVKINGKWWVTGTQELCSNVKSWLPIKKTKIRKPRKEYVQFPTWEKFYEIAIKKLEIKSESQGGSGSGIGEGGSAIVETPGHYTCSTGVLVGNMCKICPPPHCEEQPPVSELTVTIETINDMEVSRNGHSHTRYICWEVAGASNIGAVETALVVEYGDLEGGVEYKGGIKFCQLYKSPSEVVTEEYFAWARDNTGAYGESKLKTFPVYGEAPGWET